MWKETIVAQAEHEETQALEWEKPLWYVLAFIISSKRRRINKTSSADEMLNTTSRILFALSSSSGLFPGFLDDKREPIPFEDGLERDKYWHSTFEIPYALWMYGKAHLETPQGPKKSGDSRGSQPQGSQVKDGGQLRQRMTKKMDFASFDNSISKNRLVEVSDDWLREPPACLNFDSKPDFAIKEHPYLGRVIRDAVTPPSLYPISALTGMVFDVPKNSSNPGTGQSELELQKSPESNEKIEGILAATRTAHTARG